MNSHLIYLIVIEMSQEVNNLEDSDRSGAGATNAASLPSRPTDEQDQRYEGRFQEEKRGELILSEFPSALANPTARCAR